MKHVSCRWRRILELLLSLSIHGAIMLLGVASSLANRSTVKNRAHSEGGCILGIPNWVIYTYQIYHITHDQLSIWMHIWFHSFTAQCHLNLHFSCVLVELDHFTASTTLSDSQKTRLVALSVGRATEFRPFLEEIPSKLPYFGLPSSFPALCLGKV